MIEVMESSALNKLRFNVATTSQLRKSKKLFSCLDLLR